MNIKAYDQIKPFKEYIIYTYNESYGKIWIHIFKYENPQIRNAYNILTELPINKINARGALLGNQNMNNIKIKN